MQASLKTNRLTAVTMSVFLAGVLFLTGCSNMPTASDTIKTEPTVLSRTSLSADGPDMSPVNLYVEQVISAEHGGHLTLLDVVLDIPAGAVPNDTLFSIFIPDDEIFFNEFGTDGLVFDRPVTITMSYRDADLSGVNESTIRIGWFNKRTGSWEDMVCKVDFDNKTVTAQVYHFSAYGLISD